MQTRESTKVKREDQRSLRVQPDEKRVQPWWRSRIEAAQSRCVRIGMRLALLGADLTTYVSCILAEHIDD
jgi:hypothetical protein